jgi:hypothetical protein
MNYSKYELNNFELIDDKYSEMTLWFVDYYLEKKRIYLD